MKECDTDRVLQIRQAVRDQAHCEMPAVESLGSALYRWGTTATASGIEILGLALLWFAIGLLCGRRKVR